MKSGIKSIAMKPATHRAATSAFDSDTDGEDADVVYAKQTSCSPAVKSFVVPTSLKRFSMDGEWAGPQMQAMGDWQRALRKSGFVKAADLIKSTKGKERRKSLAHRLSLCKTDSDMYAIETWTKGVTDKNKQTKGWLSKFQIWKLKDLPPTGNCFVLNVTHAWLA